MRAIAVEKSVIRPAEPPVRVLVLDNSAAESHDILGRLRSAGMAIEAKVVSERREYLDAISMEEFSIILASSQLASWSGMEAFEELQKAGKLTPFVLVTRGDSEEKTTECLERGVADYVAKDDLARLPVAVRHAVEERKLYEANREARRKLEESETRNRELIENSVYGIFRVDLNGIFLFANSALLEMLACPSFEVLQTLNFMTDVFRYPAHSAKLVASCRRDGVVHNAETEWRRKDGGLVAVKVHLRHLRDADGAGQIEGVADDITELRSLEHQLLQASKFETIGQLAGGVAHDFNNVVGAILGWAELGYEESLALPRIAERFARIREQADRAAKLTQELLAFARCQHLQQRPVDLNTIVGNLTSFLDKVIGRDIEMKVVPGVLPPIQVDPAQTEQILMNLCLNARDAMREGGRLLIRTEMEQVDEAFCRFYPDARPGSYVVLTVADTGVGMTPEIRERIFEPFFTTKEPATGSGMGLATAYGITKQHGGFIHVYSETGQGSLFRVYLPTNGEGAEVSVKAKAEGVDAPVTTGTGETILLAEDHDSVREMVRQWLVNLGYRVLAAANGEEAKKLCEQEAPSLAILDVVMPQLGGCSTAESLRSRFPALPVLFTSGYLESVDGPQLPNSFYLQKPYSPARLGRMIREILPSTTSGRGDLDPPKLNADAPG